MPLEGEEAERAHVHVIIDGEVKPVHVVRNDSLQIASGPLCHPDPNVDVAVFKVQSIDPHTPVVPLGSHLDDWIGRSDFVLTEAVIMGYPPIPMAKDPVLVGARAEVNAQIDLYDTPNVHFVLSATARGGFSGGLAYSEYDFALGMVTRSLLVNGDSVESGFMSVVGVEPIYHCLGHHKLLPDCQAEQWDGLWNTINVDFLTPDNYGVASVGVFDDGKSFYVEIHCDVDMNTFWAMLAAAREAAGGTVAYTEIREGMGRLHLPDHAEAGSARALAAGRAAVAVIRATGLKPLPHSRQSEALLNSV